VVLVVPVKQILAVARYRMTSSVSAIRCDGDKRIAISLPEGSIVTVELGERVLPKGLVEVSWDGKRLLMFAVDLRERAEQVRVRGAGKRT
jgi:hypothetical protein